MREGLEWRPRLTLTKTLTSKQVRIRYIECPKSRGHLCTQLPASINRLESQASTHLTLVIGLLRVDCVSCNAGKGSGTGGEMKRGREGRTKKDEKLNRIAGLC